MQSDQNSKPLKKRRIAIAVFLIIGFGAIEFPGILFTGNKIYPRIFGLPFLYGYILCCWIYMCSVLFYACRTKWGKTTFLQLGE